MGRARRTLRLAAAGLWLAAAAAHAQAPDSLGRDTPRGAVMGFQRAAVEGNWTRATAYLDVSGLPPDAEGLADGGLAQQLAVVLERSAAVDIDGLSDLPEGAAEAELAADREQIATLSLRGQPVDLRLIRKPTRDGSQVWMIAPTTVARIHELYRQYGYGWWGDFLPASFFRTRVLGLDLRQWLALAVLMVLGFLLSLAGAKLLTAIVRPLVRRSEITWDDELLRLAAGPLRLGLTAHIMVGGALTLGLTPRAETILLVGAKMISVAAVTWFAMRMLDLFVAIGRDRLRARDLTAADTLLPMGRRIAKIFVAIIAVLSLLQNMGFNIAGILAGLGVGGLAVALAAQKTLENFFGGVAVIADRPAKVGDFCKVGETLGNVEDIGLRSTRIRTLDRTLVTIPNAEFSTARIENYALRDRIRFHAILGVGYDTTPDQMRFLLAEARKMLRDHPRVLPDPCRVRFVRFGAYSLDLEVFAYVGTSDYNEYLGIAEELNLRFMDVVAASGARFAFPSQTLYLAREEPADLEARQAAERAVSGWRERGELSS